MSRRDQDEILDMLLLCLTAAFGAFLIAAFCF